MKKFLSYCLVALMLVACVSVAVGAVDFVAGKGYNLYSGASYGEAVNEGRAPVTMNINADGSASVEQAGYYKDPTGDEYFGGIATAKKVGLNGLEVEVAFDEVPAVSSTSDCWFGIHLMEYPKVFHTGKVTENRGYIPLIRFNRPNITFYEGVTGFSSTGQSEVNPNIFGFKAGDVIKMSVKYELGQFLITYTQGDVVYEVPADQTLKLSDEVFVDGTAYVVLTGTCLGAESNFKYNVKVTEGAALTEEQIASKAFDKSKMAASETIDDAVEDVADFLADAVEIAAGSTAAEVTDAIAAIEAANAAVVAAKEALVAATEQEAVDAALQAAITAKNDAKANLDAVETYIENFGAEEAPVEETPAEETPAVEDAPAVDEAPEAEGGANVGLIIAIIVIVVVVVAVVLVVLKKKKK